MLHSTLRAAAMAVALLPALTDAASLTLDQALDLAVQRSQATQSARAGQRSATETARAAGQRLDPTLRVGVDNLPVTGSDRLSTTRDSMTMKRIGIGQEWLSDDKRAARQAAADAMVDRASLAVLAAEADVRLQTAMAYLDAYFAGEALVLTTRSEHHVHEEFEAAKARLASPDGSSQDVLAAMGARGIADDESADVRQQQSAARVALERWIGVAADGLDVPPDTPLPDERSYVARHPAVLAADRDSALARQEAAVTAANRRPNWSWELSYGQRTGYSDMVSVGVSIPLPVAPAERQDRETAAKLALVDQAEGMRVEAMRAATADYRAGASDVERLAERIGRYETAVVVPTRQRTAAALAGYRSNQLGLTALFEARHMEVEAERKLLSLRRDLAKARTQLALRPLAIGGAQ